MALVQGAVSPPTLLHLSRSLTEQRAASKRKGIWMGGNPPVGYDVDSRKLVVNPVEADTVRLIFQRYLELG